ncbi:uncharacterized protein LOC131952759 [Physella acuta]|uniref:uncharacterized protein LOC131952759 n=1 Tax=Physella acuta TaxID=109671 RepID=UPI0027DB2816|nr:uncharacterized protein LOC131952759 [Physella acuta]
MYALITTVLVVFSFPVPAINADQSKLLDHLRSKTWPWFGETCLKICGNQPTPYTPCFNLRPGKVESVLERAGIPTSVSPKADLSVIFASPQESVDVCGKAAPMPAVNKFQINANGRAVPKRLKLGAEIYRNRPSLSWHIEAGVSYSVLIWDVGLLKVRGYWSNVSKVDNKIIGKRNILYAPPANPSKVVNPILIVVVKEVANSNAANINSKCKDRVASEKGGEHCRTAVMALFDNGQNIVGLQAYYTDGSSLYEQYRACIEGYICSTSCISKFKEYARQEKQNIRFIKFDPETIDMYVNIRTYSMYNQMVSPGQCSQIRIVAPIFEFRPRPGDNYQVDTNYKVTNDLYGFAFNLDVEFSGDEKTWTDRSVRYAILLVSPDGHTNVDDYGNKPQGCLFYANLQLPYNASFDAFKSLLNYARVQHAKDMTLHYYVLLYSYQNGVTENPLCIGVDEYECQDSWDMNKLPVDFKLRGISWFLLKKDIFSDMSEDASCPENSDPEAELDPPERFEILTTEEVDADPQEEVVMCGTAQAPNAPNAPPKNFATTISPMRLILMLFVVLNIIITRLSAALLGFDI